MTEYFNYDQLTWPEVADLPRDMPLVLPLGTGYDLKRLAEVFIQSVSHWTLASFPIWLARQWIGNSRRCAWNIYQQFDFEFAR